MNSSIMQSTLGIVIVFTVACVTGWQSCELCECTTTITFPESWTGLRVGACIGAKNMTSVPSTEVLPSDTEVLFFTGTSIPTLQENQFISYEDLRIISMAFGQVSKLENHTFRNMTKVTEINLMENLLTELPLGIFSDTPNIIEITLASNKLTVLPTNLFANLKYLNKVSLGSNPITSVESNCFTNVPQLESLYFYRCKLTGLSTDILDDWSSLKMLQLAGNPWHCDEKLCDVMKIVVDRKLWGRLSTPACTTPTSAERRNWITVVEQCPHAENATELSQAANGFV